MLCQIGERELADCQIPLSFEAAKHIINREQVMLTIALTAATCPQHGFPSSHYGTVEAGRRTFEWLKRYREYLRIRS
jgi:hypothetical protein